MLTDDGIRERHGMQCRMAGYADVRPVTVREGEASIVLDRCTDEREMTPYQARYLAAKLYRLARRIRQRTDAA